MGCNLEWAAKPPRDHLFLGTCRFAATFLPTCSCLGLSALLRRTGQQATLSTSYSGILHVVCYSPFDGPRDLRTETGTEREWVRGVRDWQQEMLGRSWAGTPRGFSKRTTWPAHVGLELGCEGSTTLDRPLHTLFCSKIGSSFIVAGT